MSHTQVGLDLVFSLNWDTVYVLVKVGHPYQLKPGRTLSALIN